SLHPDRQSAEGAVEVIEAQAKSLAPLDTSAVVDIAMPGTDEAVLAVDTRPTNSLKSNTSDLDPGALVVVADSVDLPAKAPLGTLFIGIGTTSDDRTQLSSGEVVLQARAEAIPSHVVRPTSSGIQIISIIESKQSPIEYSYPLR